MATQNDGLVEIESITPDPVTYAIPAEFSEFVFEDFETIRDLGICNMIDRRCVGEAAHELLDDYADLKTIVEDKKAYGRLLIAFGAWKQAQEA